MANYELSNRIYELRTQKGLSQKELGAILGVSNKAVSKWETGTAIPKTETLIKLAEVFEISTEELLNMALPLQTAQPTSESIMINPVNARIGKTLGEFRAEHGLYLKDVAEKIGVSEEELQAVEDSYLVPDEIAEKLVTAYNLPENNFAKPIYKSKTVTKKYFLKTAFIYEIILGFICAVPLVFGGMLESFAGIFNVDILEGVARNVSEIYYYLSPVIITVGCIRLGKYLTEKSGYFGDFDKYRFLYATIPVAASVSINEFSNLIFELIRDYVREGTDGFASVAFQLLQVVLSFLLSIVSTAVIVIVLAMLMNIAIEHNKERARTIFKKIAILVTISSVIAFVIEKVIYAINFTHFDLVPDFEDIWIYGINIIMVWLVYSIKEQNLKKEKWAFKILPLLSIWGIMIELVIGLIGLGFDYSLEMLGEWMDSLIF